MSTRDVARAIDACRRGWSVTMQADAGPLSLLPVENADAARLQAFAPFGCDVLLSPERAATLALGNQRDAAGGGAVCVAHASWLDLDAAVALADPALDLAHPFKGPFRTVAVTDQVAAGAALKLARLAGLLPAFFVQDGMQAEDAPVVTARDIIDYDLPSRLTLASRARLPIAHVDQCEIVAFRSADDPGEHIALVVGAPSGEPPLVRLHSECLTGDVFGSLKCDCGPQLDLALKRIASAGWGILLYLRQEGRGIGLVNKLRTYALQDQGFDTVDANLRLGFATDVRDFGTAASMLQLLGQRRVQLLTNNPQKVAALIAHGIDVAERVPHVVAGNSHNLGYLHAKRDRTGHFL